jgi:hypothetical protein
MRLPDFVIVGAMRSGTTTLSRALGDVPGIDMAAGKEAHFFDDHYALGLDWYAGLFADLPAGSIVGEATPNYMHDATARDRILSDLPETRLVAVLRNPIDRAWSHYWFNVSREKESLSFEEALEAEPSRLSASAPDRRVYSYIDRGRYADQLLPLAEKAGVDRMYVMYFEDLVAQPGSELGRLERFLGVGAGASGRRNLDMPQVNRYVEFRSIRVRSFARHLPQPLRRVVGRLNAKTRVSYPKMSDQTRELLREQFTGTVLRTTSLVGRAPLRWTDWYERPSGG